MIRGWFVAAKKCRRVVLVALVLLATMMIYSFATSISCHFHPDGCGPDSRLSLFGQHLDFVDSRRASPTSTSLISAHLNLEKALNKTVIPDHIDHPLLYPPDQVPVYDTFADAVKARADENNLILLSSLDQGYVDMAINLWETSFKRFNINNFLFVCTDEEAVELMRSRGLPCFLGFTVKSKASQSIYGSAAFKEKTHIKTKIILEALELGYDVLIVDVDIVFLKNPILHFDCDDCDIQIQTDGPEINSGFYYVRPTRPAVKLHASALELAHRSRGLSNQQCINRLLSAMLKRKELKVKILSTDTFPRGNIFFEQGKRMYADDPPCDSCVIVHNNWIVGGSAKIYRFKEFLMWLVDTNGYYSSNSTKYILYNNLVSFPGKDGTNKAETASLKTALSIGKLLNRVVILPAFHCDGCKYDACKNPKGRCSLNTHFNIKEFDRYFRNNYREHMFLQHPKVPGSVKDSLSPTYLIKSSVSETYKDDKKFNLVKADTSFAPKDTSVTPGEIITWFKTPEIEKYSVLRFHTLYNNIELDDTDFVKTLSSALKPAGYRQY